MKYHRKEIDGLRALAVIPVVLFHAGFTFIRGGYIGVDIFFVISGYLITGIIFEELQNHNFSFRSFYERRARRILPALFLVILVCLPPAYFLLPPQALVDFMKSEVAVITFSSNFLFYSQSGYFDQSAALKPLLHTWSLAVEEQFYILFPLVLAATYKFARRLLVPILISIFILSLLAAQCGGNLATSRYAAATNWTWTNAPAWAFYMLPTRMWELVIGSWVSIHSAKTNHTTKQFNNAASLLGVFLVIFAIFGFTENSGVPGLVTLLPTAGAAAILAFAKEGTIVNRLLSTKALVGIGLISYSFYLWHLPLFVFARIATLEEPRPEIFVLLTFVALGLAALTWKYVEQPFRKNGKISIAMLIGICVFASALILAAYVATIKTKGFADLRLNVMQKHILSTALNSPMRKACHGNDDHYISPQEACEYFLPGSSWAVFGNSHAVELSYSLANELKKTNQGLRQFTFTGCSPADYTLNDITSNCAKWTKETVKFIAQDAKIETVIVSYRFTDKIAKANPQEQTIIWQSYLAILKTFTNSGKHVVLVLQAPLLDSDVSDLIFRDTTSQNIVGTKRVRWNRLSSFLNLHLADLPKNITVIDPADSFCDSINCYAVKDGTALYFDEHHMSVAGAAVLATKILNRP